MDIKALIKEPIITKAFRALAALFAALSLLGGIILLASEGVVMSSASSMSSVYSFLDHPDRFLDLFVGLDGILGGAAMAKVMSIICFALSLITLGLANQSKHNMMFSLIGCGTSLIQFIMGIITSPCTVTGMLKKAMNDKTPVPPVAIVVILMVMAALTATINILALFMNDTQLINKLKQSMQTPAQPRQPNMMGQPQQFRQPMQQPMAPQQPMQQPAPMAQPQQVYPGQVQQPMMGQPMQVQQPMASQQPVPQAQPVQQPAPMAQPQPQQMNPQQPNNFNHQ